MEKDQAIAVLEDIDQDSCNLTKKQKDAIDYAVKALKRGSKSWKGYRRFKRKYVALRFAVDRCRQSILGMSQSSEKCDFVKTFLNYFPEDSKECKKKENEDTK